MPKKQGLGKGYDAIFDENNIAERRGVSMLRISEVEPRKDQPRKQFEAEALAELADSISLHGVLQPILVRKGSLGMYEIIAGERRWRAAKQAGLSEIPAQIIEADDLKVAEVALIENIQRENLSPFEEAAAYVELMKTHGMTQEQVADKLGKRRSTITNSIRLLDLPEEIVLLIQKGELSASHGKALLGLETNVMLSLAEKIIKRNLSVRETEAAVKRAKRASAYPDKNPDNPAISVDYIEELEKKIMSASGRRVHIVEGKYRKSLQIEYADNKDLEELVERLCGEKIEL